MEFTQHDREELYQVWMSKKANMRLMQMEVAKSLGISQNEFSGLLRGNTPLTFSFIKQFCQLMHIDPAQAIPSLRNSGIDISKQLLLKTRLSVDGDIQRTYIEGNEVVIEYIHRVQ